MRPASSRLKRDSNLTVDLASSDAEELQAVLISSGLLPAVEDEMRLWDIGLAGQLTFNGNIRGRLESPDVDRTVLARIAACQRNRTGLTLRVDRDEQFGNPDSRWPSHGARWRRHAVFTRDAANRREQHSIEATLDRMNARALAGAVAIEQHEQIASDTEGDLSGQVKITGIPNAMSGAPICGLDQAGSLASR